MSKVHTEKLSVRIPAALIEAIEDRAEALGVRPTDVVRAGLVREIESPLDPRSRSFVAAWLEGAEATPNPQ